MTLTKTFSELDKNDAPIAGGKGASLGEMTKVGIPVPPGFVVLASTFDKFLEATDLNIEVDSIISQVKHNEIHTVEEASKVIQALIMNATVPKEIEQEIESEFAKLNTKYVAVRSSATAEDSSSAAWAGQLDSFLNTTTLDLLENVKKCWASLFTPRAIFYRFEKELDKQQISVAVVVQKMVESEVSGIAFSVHPVTEDYNQIIIEAGFGLGEAVVSGQITPDSYVLTKEPRTILDKNISIQERGIYRHPSDQGNDWQDISEDQGSTQCLTDQEILDLTDIILTIENHYGFPCDIEWAYEGQKFYIVQSRPITTLAHIVPVDDNKITDSRLENDLNNFSHLNYHFFHHRFRTPIYTYFLWEGLTHHHNKNVSFDYEINNMIDLDNDLAVEAKEWHGLMERINNYLKHDHDLLDKLMSQAVELDDRTQTLIKNLQTGKKNRLENLELFFNYTYQFGAFNIFALLVEKNFEERLQEIIKNKFSQENSKIFQILTTPQELSAVQEKELDILTIANLKPEQRERAIKKHVKKFAWLKNGSYDGVFYSDKEILEEVEKIQNPEQAISKYKAKLKEQTKEFAKYFNALEEADKKFVETLLKSINFRSWRTERFYANAFALDEVYQDLGKKLGLTDYTDIFYLLPSEILSLLKEGQLANSQVIAERKAGYVMLSDKVSTRIYSGEAVLRFKDRVDVKEAIENKTDEIKGQTAYPGLVRGKVRIISSKVDLFKVEQDEIVVTEMTTPDFIPALKKAKAIVTNEGGITCHAAIIARELKIPCVIGTKIATQILHDGDLVEVDADKGIVRILKGNKSLTILPVDPAGDIFRWGPLAFEYFCGGDFLYSFTIGYAKKFMDNFWPKTVVLFKDNEFVWVQDFVELRKRGGEVFKKYVLTPEYKKQKQAYNEAVKRLHEQEKKIESTPLADLSNEQLALLLSETNQVMVDFWLPTVPAEMGNYGSIEVLHQELSAVINDTKVVDEILRVLTTSEKLSFYQEEEIALQETNNIHQHQQNYFWLHNSYAGAEYLSEDYFSTRKKELKPNLRSEQERRIKEIRQKKLAVIKENKLSQDIVAMAERILEAMEYQDDRKKENWISQHYKGLLLREVKRRLGRDDLNRYGLWELAEILMGGQAQRLENFGFILDEGNLLELDKSTAEQYWQIYAQDKATETDKIKGIVVNGGRVVGRVKIVRNPKDKTIVFSEGEILVTPMTSPDYVFLIKKSVAVITDTGGLTSHAAIVSRELDKPCIVGTKIATQILHDGDLVEVDADNGVVTILEKKENPIFLDKIFSREKSLMYMMMWDISERLGYKKFINYELKNSLFIFDSATKKTSVWYDNHEAETISSLLTARVEENKHFVDEVIKCLDENWKIISPYLLRQETIKTVAEFKKYYQGLTEWWSAMNTVYPLINISDISEEAGKIFLAYREKTERYTGEMDSLIMEFWSKHLKQAYLSLVPYLLVDEAVSLVEANTKNLPAIKDRSHGFGIYYGQVYPDQAWQEIMKKNNLFFKKLEDSEVNEFSGVSAYPGLVRGLVKKIIVKSDIHDLKEGEILVAEATYPDHVPAMKKAVAFITDEGGITCHAAIASRELKKPCVVGTKIATQVLHDGDEVEVDADKGIVRIIRKNEVTDQKIVFKKGYTRDCSMILEEAFFDAQINGCDKFIGEHNPERMPNVFVVNDGLLEIWENQSCIQWIKDKLVMMAKNKPERVMEFLDHYPASYSQLEKQWALTDEELKKVDINEYYQVFYEALSIGFAWFYLAGDERTPDEIKQKALLIRAGDNLMDGTDTFLRRLILARAPQLAGLETCLLREDVVGLAQGNIGEIKLLAEARHKHWVFAPGRLNTFDELDKITEFKFENYSGPELDGGELSGQVAFPGKVRGIVKILKKKSEVDKVEFGDVIVSPMTIPDFVPAMKKAVAFVTDEGGITCHASIIARELKKPCIIGTKLATQVLHDGDLVEVDADNGVVRILKKSGVDKVELLNELKKVDWEVQRFNAYPFFISGTATASGFKLPWGLKYTHFLCISHSKNVEWHYDKSDYQRIGNIFWNKVAKLDDLSELINEYRATYKTAVEKAEYDEEKLKNYSVEELKALLARQADLLCAGAGTAHIVECASVVAEQKLLHEYKIDPTTIRPSELSFLGQAGLYAHELCESGKTDEEILTAFKDKYAWVQSSYLGRNDISIEKIRELAHKAEAQTDKKYTNDEKNKHDIFTELLSHLFSWQDERKANILKSVYKSQPVLNALADKLNISQESIKFLLPEEIEKITDKNFQAELSQRTKLFVDYASHSSPRVTYVGVEAQNFIDNFIKHVSTDDNLLKGQTAFKGFARGVVRICLSLKSIDNFQAGEILVASMTRPEYIPAMKKALAFITNEGGVTCHAAIISRELKKPCVIGTKVATKVLHDGDLVEVDADNGVVRILKRADGDDFFADKAKVEKYIRGNLFDVQSAKVCYIACDLVFRIYEEYIGQHIGDFPILSFVNAQNNFQQTIAESGIMSIGEHVYGIFQEQGLSAVKKLVRRHQVLTEELGASYAKVVTGQDFIKKYLPLFKDWWRLGLLMEDKGQFSYGKLEELLLSRFTKDQTKEIIRVMLGGSDFSVFSQEHVFLCQICAKVLTDRKVSEEVMAENFDTLRQTFLESDFQEYYRNFFYFATDFFDRQILDFPSFILKIKHEITGRDRAYFLQEVASRQDNLQGDIELKEKFSRQLNTQEKELIGLVNCLLDWSEIRKAGMMKSFYYFYDFLHDLAEEKNITYAEISAMTVPELVDYINNNTWPDLAVRDTDKLTIYHNQAVTLYLDADARHFLSLVNTEIKDLSGQVASKGRGNVRGIVRVIKDPSNCSFNQGEILVTSMTRIEFVPLMNKAVAIITDEGGIACHAAIISRELGIACIIGTKIATKVLHDGDEVEVDVDKGEVRIINKAKDDRPSVKKNLISEFLTKINYGPIYPFHGAFAPTTLFLPWCSSSVADIQRGDFSCLAIGRGRDFFWAISETEYKLSAQKALSAYLANKVSIKELKDSYQAVNERIDQDYNFFINSQPADSLEEALIKLASDSRNNLSELIAKTLFLEALDYDVARRVFDENNSGDLDIIWERATHPYFLSFEIRRFKAIMEAVKQSVGLDQLARKFSFIYTDYYEAKPLVFIKKELADFIETPDKYMAIIHKAEADLVEAKKDYQLWLDSLTPAQLRLAEYIQYIMEGRDVRKDDIAKVQNISYNVIRELIVRAGLNESHNPFITSYDVERGIDWLTNSRAELELRKDGMIALINSDGTYDIQSGDFDSNYQEFVERTKKDHDGDELTGQSACPGKVTGLVRIITDPKKQTVFNQGEVLVTSMTRPEFVPMMKKAIAVVTNEGGITCHAAIISRELKIPCVIGTKFATQVLHDGDEVEVDADKGIVRIIKKANDDKSGNEPGTASAVLAKKYIHKMKGEEITKQDGNFSVVNFLQAGTIPVAIREELKERAKFFVHIIEENKRTWLLGEEAREFMRVNEIMGIADKVKEIKGSVASGGKVSGIVKVCESSTEIWKVEEGDILVTAMTTPDFVPAMRKAAAIITNEGGITCHAAIVSRELNKPCIIGTKIATKVLHDGDEVEVDADKGIVTIIKSNES